MWKKRLLINPRSCLGLPLRLLTQVGAAGQEDAGAIEHKISQFYERNETVNAKQVMAISDF
jgi:hypothetical protein